MPNIKNKKGFFYLFYGLIVGVIVGGLGLAAAYQEMERRYGDPTPEKVSFGVQKVVEQVKEETKKEIKKNIAKVKKVEPKELVFDIDVNNAQRPINPLIYGSNLTPKTEFEMDIAKFSRDVGITNYRYPGGGSPGYRWKLGNFDFSDRTDDAPLSEMSNVIEFSRIAGANLVIQVNVESGTPEEAAEWVDFMNNNKKGMPVVYWELGNEVYGDWDKAYMTGKEYVEVIKKYSKAMKAVDPTIKIGANWGGPRYQSFDEAIIQYAADDIDFVSYHWYPNHVNKDHKYKDRYHPLPEELMANSMAVERIKERLDGLIREYAPQREGKIELTVMEWDGSWDGASSDLERKFKGRMWSLSNAIFFANTLGEFAKHGVTVANQYCLQEVMFGLIRGWDKQAGWGGSRWDGRTIRPKALAIQLFAQYFGDVLVDGAVAGSETYFKDRDWRADSYTGEVPYVQGYASKFSKDNKMAMVITNKHASKNYPLKINLKGFDPKDKGRTWIITSDSLIDQNDGSPQKIEIQEFQITDVAQTFYFNVPSKSIVMIQLDGKS